MPPIGGIPTAPKKAKKKVIYGPPAPKKKPVYGPPAPKKQVTVAPADRVSERVEARKKQLKVSVRKAGDAPQDRAADTAKANAYKKTDKYVADVQNAQPASRRKAQVGVYKKGASPRDTLRKVLTSGKTSKPAPLAQARSQQVVAAPVLKVLNQTTRPLHAVAAAAKEDVRTVKAEGLGHYLAHGTEGRSIKAAGQGIRNKDKSTFSDVFTEAGWKPKSGLGKFAKGAASLTADIAFDPTTYVTGGGGSVAEKAALDAARKAEKKAVKSGLTAEQAKRMGERAGKQTAKTADKTSGVTVKVGGLEVPGVRKATAKASKPVRAVGRKVAPERARTGVRNVAADVNPDITPAGVSREANRKAIQATRTGRAGVTTGERDAVNLAHGIKHVVGEDNYAAIVDAIETHRIGKLSPELRGHAVTLRSQLKHVRRVQRRAGLAVGEVKHRSQVQVPAVTADTAASAKALAKAKRAEARAHREHEAARAARDVHQGRAEVLSRNVGGVAAEKAAARGRRVRKLAAHEKPVPEGHVRLYRGQGVTHDRSKHDWADAPEGAGKTQGRWFTDSPERAKGYSDAGMKMPGYVTYVDVPKAIADAAHHSDPKTGSTFVLPPEWAKHATEAEPGSRVAAIAEHRAREASAGTAEEIRHRRAVARAKVMGEEPPPAPRVRPASEPARIHHPDARSKRKRKTADAAYAGGGHGVRQTTSAATDAAQRVKNAHATREAAEAAHTKELAAASTQRAEKLRAEKLNAKRNTGVKGYVPRSLTPAAREALDKKPVAIGKRSTKPASSKARKRQGTLAELQAKHPGEYRTDLHAVVAERMAEGTASAAQAGLNRALADVGHALKRGKAPNVEPGEAVYHIKAGNAPREVTDKAEIARAVTPLRLNKTGTKLKGATPRGVGAGRYVVLPKEVVKRASEGIKPTLGWSNKGIVRGYDKTQAGFKTTALATLGFHVRNAIGDTSQAYIHQPGQKLAGNMVRAGRVLKAAGRDEKAQRALTQATEGTGHLKTKRYGKVSYEEAAHHLIAAGAARSGKTGAELRELAQSGQAGFKIPKAHAPAGLKRFVLNREDLPRLATAIHAVREGATWEEAAQKVADAHFDYAHLTEFERNVARRLAPFYTFTARNLPLQSKRIITNPGKYAAYQKVREEAANIVQPDKQDPQTQALYKQLEASGVKLSGGWERYLSEFEQRNAGVPVKWKGRTFTLSAGLPLNDLNSIPGAAVPGQTREWVDKVMSLATPVLKDPIELGHNYSFFFRDQIERDNSPLVNAPGFVGGWPDSAKRKLGVVRGEDKQTGKAVWKWPGKVDYVAHIPPGMVSQALKQATPGTDRTNRGGAAKALGFAGIRAQPVDATSNAVNMAYARVAVIDKRQAALRQTKNPANGQLIGAKNPTPEYTRLSLQRKIANQIAYQGKSQRGDAKLPTTGGPPKVRSSAGRVKVPGVGGRVRVPGVGGRVKIP